MKNRKRLLSTALGLCFVTSSLQLGIIDVFGTGPSAHAAVIQDAGQHWDASQDLKDYLSRPIDWTHPTLAPKGKIDVNTAQEYLVKAISEMQSTVVFYGDYDLSDKAIAPLIYKHPNGSLIRHIAGDWKVDKEEVSFEKGLYKHTVRFAYLVSKEDAIRADRRIDEIVRFLTKKLNRLKDVPGTRNSNEYRKARLIHDYIIKNVKPIADEQTATGHYYVKSAAGDGKQYEIHSLEAGLFANQGVCQTYTIMFDRIASRMGLQTRYVRGKKSFGYFTNDSEKERLLQQVKADERIAAKGGRWPEANHSWNQVKIDGHWYHLDLTVDAVSSRSMYKYTYAGFLRTDEEFGEPTTWWIGEHHKKNYSAFANVTWNQSEAEPATKPMNFGKLFSSYSSSRPLQSNLSGSRHPLGNFSDDEVGVLPLKQYSAETSSVSQIVSPYGEKEVAEVPAGISAEDLPKTLKLQGITSAIPTESYKLGTFEDSPVSLAKPDDWEKAKDRIGTHLSLDFVAENGAKLTIPISVVEPGKESHALARIDTGSGHIHIDQIHPSGDDYDAHADKEAFDNRRKEAEQAILTNVKVSYADGTSDTSTIDVSVRGLENVKVDKPGSYSVLIIAKGKDNLRTKADYTVVVDKKLKASSVTIFTNNNNAAEFNIPANTHYYMDPSSFHSFLGKNEGVNLIAKRKTSLGLTKQVNDTIALIDSTGKEWPYNEDEDMFIDADGNRLFNGIKMVDLVRKAGSYRIKVTGQYAQEEPKVKVITVNIIDDKDTITEADRHKAIMTVDKIDSLSMTARIKYIQEIRELSSSSAINDLVDRASSKPVEKTTVSYIVEHIDKETGKPFSAPMKKIEFQGTTVTEHAESYYLNKGYTVDKPVQEMKVTGNDQKITFIYTRQAK